MILITSAGMYYCSSRRTVFVMFIQHDSTQYTISERNINRYFGNAGSDLSSVRKQQLWASSRRIMSVTNT